MTKFMQVHLRQSSSSSLPLFQYSVKRGRFSSLRWNNVRFFIDGLFDLNSYRNY